MELMVERLKMEMEAWDNLGLQGHGTSGHFLQDLRSQPGAKIYCSWQLLHSANLLTEAVSQGPSPGPR